MMSGVTTSATRKVLSPSEASVSANQPPSVDHWSGSDEHSDAFMGQAPAQMRASPASRLKSAPRSW
eukprot:5962679-Prymnesium_polylepis.1